MAPDINEFALCTRDKCPDTIQDFYLNPPPPKSVLAYVSISVIIYILLNKCILPLLNKGLSLFLAYGIYDATVALADNGFAFIAFGRWCVDKGIVQLLH